MARGNPAFIRMFFVIAHKIFLQQTPGAHLAETDPLHSRRHLLVLGCEILRIEQLVDLNSSPLSTFHPPTTSSTTLQQCRKLVVGAQENYYIYVREVNTEEHLIKSRHLKKL